MNIPNHRTDNDFSASVNFNPQFQLSSASSSPASVPGPAPVSQSAVRESRSSRFNLFGYMRSKRNDALLSKHKVQIEALQLAIKEPDQYILAYRYLGLCSVLNERDKLEIDLNGKKETLTKLSCCIKALEADYRFPNAFRNLAYGLSREDLVEVVLDGKKEILSRIDCILWAMELKPSPQHWADLGFFLKGPGGPLTQAMSPTRVIYLHVNGKEVRFDSEECMMKSRMMIIEQSRNRRH